MIRPAAVVLALALPLTSLAQEMGLDLSGDAESPKSEDTQQSQDAAYEAALAAPAGAPIQAKSDARSTSQAPVSGRAGTVQDLTEVERDITHEDRVKSVQRKVYRKAGRFELTPMFQVSVNDPYYFKLGTSLRAGYYLADTLAISARVGGFLVQPDDAARVAKRTFQSRIFYSVPQWTAMGDIEWSPIYGKVAFLNDILHFDAYLLGGVGVVNTEAASVVINEATGEKRGLVPGADLGIGARFVARDFLAVNLSLINTTYVDQPAGTSKGATQNLMTLNLGISVFFPFTSTGREAE